MAKEQSEKTTLDHLVKAVLKLSKGYDDNHGYCFCEFSLGNPNYKDHLGSCRELEFIIRELGY